MQHDALRRLVLVDAFAWSSALALVCVPPPSDHLLRDPDALALALAWGVALAAALHLAVTLTCCAGALARREHSRALRSGTRLPRALRPLVELAVAGSLVTAPASPARAASAAGTPVVRVTRVADTPVVRALPPPARRPNAASLPHRHVVVPGDNLWRIARDTLAAAGHRVAQPGDVAPYWRMVVEANRATVRSGNPNLIFPGEIVTLPPIL